MPIQAPSWTEFLSCPICCNEFSTTERLPISLGCGHTICRLCLASIHNHQCPYDQTTITIHIDNLPINNALLQLLDNDKIDNCTNSNNDIYNNDEENENMPPSVLSLAPEDLKNYQLAKKCIESLALHLKSFLTGNYGSLLSRPMQRKVVTLVNCQLMEEEGRIRVLRAARLLGERTVTELILHHQNPQQLSINLWAAVRSRGCQFLGPAMQEEVLKLVLLVLENGSALSRKVLVLFVVQRLEKKFPQASKTSIGHVVQLLYRASCFKVSKREADSSLMQLKEEFRTYDALRREHDAQIVQIATEAGLRIAPDQWSTLLYGDVIHKSHMQSIIDKLQSPSSFAQSVQELVIALQRTGDPAKLAGLHDHLKHLAGIDPSLESITPTWEEVAKALDAVRDVVIGLVDFVRHHGNRKLQDNSVQGSSTVKYKISLCRDHAVRRKCPRGNSCTFAHSEEERERYRAKNRKNPNSIIINDNTCGQNNTAPKKEYHSRHTNIHNPHTVMLYSNDKTTSSTSATNSPSRFSNSMHGKQSRKTFGNLTPPHLHISILEQSPIPKGNMISGVCSSIPISIQPTHHPFETPFGHLTYGMQSSTILPPSSVSAPMLPIHNSNIELHSSGTFATTSQQSNIIPINKLNATINPPILTNNNLIASETSAKNMNSNNNSYDYFDSKLPSEHTSLIFGQGNRKIRNQHVSDQFNLDQTTTSMWQQNQLNIAILKNTPVMYDAVAKPFFEKAQFQPSQKQSRFSFKSSLNNNTNNNIISGNQSNIANAVRDNYKNNEFLCNMHKSNTSYWGLHNATGVNTVDDVMSCQSRTGMQTTVPNSGVFGDRDNFVRSDSILDDDATSCDVPDVKTVENKYGPIRPLQKSITSSNFLTVSSADESLAHSIQSRNLSHSPTSFEQPPTCNTFNNFGNLQVEVPNLSVINLDSDHSNGNSSINKNKTLFGEDDNNKFVCSLNTLMTMEDINHSNSLNLNKNLSICDGLLWSKNLSRDSSAGVTVNIVHDQHISDLKSSNCWYSPTHSMSTTATIKNYNHENPKQLEIPLKSQQHNIDSGINSSMMRDIENELSEIVDKV